MTGFSSTLFRRLVFGITLVSVIAILAAATFLYMRYGAINDRFREGTLQNFGSTLIKASHGAGGSLEVSLRRSTEKAIRDADGRFVVLAEDGRLLAASEGQAEPLIPYQGTRSSYFELSGRTPRGPQYGISLRYDVPEPIYVQVAFPISDVIFDSILEDFILDIGWIWLPFVAAILITFVIVVKIALKPLSAAAQDAEAIGPNSVVRRLSEDGLPRDVFVLVKAVNNALDRMQRGYETLETFVADVAHELRTPLAIVKARLAISEEPLARELAEDFEPMERLVEQLLDRLRLGRIQFEPEDRVDLAVVATEVGRFCGPLAVSQERGIEVDGAERPAVVNGEKDFIFRALRNLVENALAHAPKNTMVTIRVSPDLAISVLDQGAGFPLDKIDPRTRLNTRGRSDRQDGVGIGLSIVDSTMAAHGGELDLRNRSEGGATATMRFPDPNDRRTVTAPEDRQRIARPLNPLAPIASRI